MARACLVSGVCASHLRRDNMVALDEDEIAELDDCPRFGLEDRLKRFEGLLVR